MTHLLLIHPDQSFYYRQVAGSPRQVELDIQMDGNRPDYIRAGLPIGKPDVKYSTFIWKEWVIALPDETGPAAVRPPRLTRRQLDVLIGLSQGLTGNQIAGRLNISRRSVSLHMSALKTTLAASTAAECVQKAARLGILNRADKGF